MGADQENAEWSKREPRSDETPGLSDDRLYRALASRQRRRLLYLLLDEEEKTTEEIATVLTDWEATKTNPMGDRNDCKQIAIALGHIHLPLLAETGLVAYDRPSDTVRIESLDPPVRDLICRSVDPELPSRS